MAYATVDDIRAIAPQVKIGPNTVPSDTQVTAFITTVEAEFESMCANLGYVIPITGARALIVTKNIVAHGALSMLLAARAYTIGKPGEQGMHDAENKYRSYLKRLADSEDLTVELTDAPRTANKLVKESADKTLGMGSEGTGDVDFDWEEPHVTRNQRF